MINRMIKWFEGSSNRIIYESHIDREFLAMAVYLDGALQEGPEKTTALRKLLESRDCAIRQMTEDMKDQNE